HLNRLDIATTVERIVSAFTPAEQSSNPERLANTLRYVISQQLIPRRNDERTAIIEIFKANPRTAQYIECDDRSGRSLLEAVKNGAADGMQHFDGEIETLVGSGMIHAETDQAYRGDHQALQTALQA